MTSCSSLSFSLWYYSIIRLNCIKGWLRTALFSKDNQSRWMVTLDRLQRFHEWLTATIHFWPIFDGLGHTFSFDGLLWKTIRVIPNQTADLNPCPVSDSRMDHDWNHKSSVRKVQKGDMRGRQCFLKDPRFTSLNSKVWLHWKILVSESKPKSLAFKARSRHCVCCMTNSGFDELPPNVFLNI